MIAINQSKKLIILIATTHSDHQSYVDSLTAQTTRKLFHSLEQHEHIPPDKYWNSTGHVNFSDTLLEQVHTI